MIREAADEDANIMFGAVIDETMRDEMKITVIATGFDKESFDAGAVAAAGALPGHAPRYAPRAGDELPLRAPAGHARADDLDVPAFIRKKAD